MASPTEITVSQLSRLVGTPDAPVLIDVRIEEDFQDDPRLIPGSFQHPFDDAASLGLSRMYRDDLAQLDAGMGLSDAFYRWSRDATDEGHDWPSAMSRS